MIHWQSCKEQDGGEFGGIWALCVDGSLQSWEEFRLLAQEALADDILLNLRCDNQATIAVLENPSWRATYFSIYGEAIRQEIKEETAILTYVNTDDQLADVLTKPTSTTMNERIYPLWGVIPGNG